MNSKIYILSNISLIIFDLCFLYFFQRSYGDIMGTINYTSLFVFLIILNLSIFFSKKVKVKTQNIIHGISISILIIIPMFFYFTKPNYLIKDAQTIVKNEIKTDFRYVGNKKVDDNKVYIFYSDSENKEYYFDPYKGEIKY